MDENFKKESKQLSALEMANKIQEQSVPFSDINRILDNLPRIAQYEQMNSAANIASKALQQSSLMPAYLESQSAIAKFAQSRAEEAVVFKDIFLEMRKGLNAYNDAISVKDRTIQSMGGMNFYTDIMASAKLAKDLVEPFRNSLDIASNAFKESESFLLSRDLYNQTQAFLDSSTAFREVSAFNRLNSFRDLESFKAISRLENFPFYEVELINISKLPEVENSDYRNIVELDSVVNAELSVVTDFNDLSKERQSILLSLYNDYYYPIILTCLVIGIWWNISLNEDLDLSNKIFTYFEGSKKVLSYLDNNFYRPSSGVIDGLVATFIYIKFPEFKENLKAVGIKKAIKLLFDSSDSAINRSMLKWCRVITQDGTSLRENHHINATEIEGLSKGTIVKIVAKEGKSWLLVEPLFNTEIGKGWILRSSTTTFK